MNKDKKFPLYYKFYQLLKSFYRMKENFERQYKYSLGEEIIELTWDCMDLVVKANAVSKEKKKKKIENLSITFDQLKIRLRIAQELEQISKGQYSHLQTNYKKKSEK